MKDVAKLANVSTSTVSHVVNNNRYVSEEITQRVLAAVAKLNYAPSAIARSLKVNETRTIGMIVSGSNNPFYAEIVKDVERSCYQRGYNLILCNTEGNSKRLLNNVETLLQRRVDGLLIMCTENLYLPDNLFCCYPNMPIVMMDWSPFNGLCDVIQDNSLLGAQIATQHLIKHGYSKIACIAGPQDKTPAQHRLAGFRLAMQQAGLPLRPEYQIFSDFHFAGGKQATETLLALNNPPHAIFASNDAMAVGVYQAINQAGLQVAKDIAVIGYDDIELAQYLYPPLTTIQQDKAQIGQRAVDTLLYRIQHRDTPSQVLSLTPRLIERQSVSHLT